MKQHGRSPGQVISEFVKAYLAGPFAGTQAEISEKRIIQKALQVNDSKKRPIEPDIGSRVFHHQVLKRFVEERPAFRRDSRKAIKEHRDFPGVVEEQVETVNGPFEWRFTFCGFVRLFERPELASGLLRISFSRRTVFSTPKVPAQRLLEEEILKRGMEPVNVHSRRSGVRRGEQDACFGVVRSRGHRVFEKQNRLFVLSQVHQGIGFSDRVGSRGFFTTTALDREAEGNREESKCSLIEFRVLHERSLFPGIHFDSGRQAGLGFELQFGFDVLVVVSQGCLDQGGSFGPGRRDLE